MKTRGTTGINGVRYGNKSTHPWEQSRRAKRRGITVEELLKIEQEEQDKIDQGFKFCKSCNQWISDFGNGAYCKKCCTNKTNSRYNLSKQRSYLLQKKYGITVDEYDKLLSAQKNRCYICHVHVSNLDRSLAVDHCHVTGKVRGLLCGSCNRFLGKINEDISTAERLVEYLKIAAKRKGK